ncbi:MAG: hypothetical protein ACJAUP_003337, partial [Cellvibrionaceae bacterium]
MIICEHAKAMEHFISLAKLYIVSGGGHDEHLTHW